MRGGIGHSLPESGHRDRCIVRHQHVAGRTVGLDATEIWKLFIGVGRRRARVMDTVPHHLEHPVRGLAQTSAWTPRSPHIGGDDRKVRLRWLPRARRDSGCLVSVLIHQRAGKSRSRQPTWIAVQLKGRYPTGCSFLWQFVDAWCHDVRRPMAGLFWRMGSSSAILALRSWQSWNHSIVGCWRSITTAGFWRETACLGATTQQAALNSIWANSGNVLEQSRHWLRLFC